MARVSKNTDPLEALFSLEEVPRSDRPVVADFVLLLRRRYLPHRMLREERCKFPKLPKQSEPRICNFREDLKIRFVEFAAFPFLLFPFLSVQFFLLHLHRKHANR